MNIINSTPNDDNLTGSDLDDLIDGGAGNDRIDGRAGNDVLTGGIGIDTLIGGTGDDTFILRVGDGGPAGAVLGVDPREEFRELPNQTGLDTLRIEGVAFEDIRIWSASGNHVTIGIDDGTGTYLETDLWAPFGTAQFWDGFERIEFDNGVVFTGDSAMVWSGLDLGQQTFGTNRNDHLVGNGGDDTIVGGAGDDTINGGTGADNLTGGAGDDLYLIAAGDGGRVPFSIDVIQESVGGGDDTISFTDLDDGELRIFATSDSGIQYLAFVGENESDRFQATYIDYTPGSFDLWDQIEEIRLADGTIMTEATGLRVYGTDENDLVYGTRAGDWLTGSLGNDEIFGFAGDDTFVANLMSNDTVNGGTGTDRAQIDLNIADVTVSLPFAGASSTTVTWSSGSMSVNSDVETITFNDITLSYAELGTYVVQTLTGTSGNDRLEGANGNDTLLGEDGTDTLIGGAGDDSITGGTSTDDLRDIVFGGAGNDTIDGGYGNDELRGDAGNDSIAGGFGADTVIGGAGDDTLTGSAFGDLIFGGDGFDFINGGFGSDRVNGGADGDRFFHLGIADHGSDWIQDYNAADGDVLVYGGMATRDQFQVNVTNTANAGADGVDEAFVIFRPTGQILWALVDGDGQSSINLRLGGQEFDLLA